MLRTVVRRASRGVTMAVLAVVLAGCKAEVYSNVTEREANEMVSVLYGAGIEASRERAKDGTYSLSVDKSSLSTAIATLSQRGLPRQHFDNLGSLFDNKRMVSTSFEERARFMFALNQELSNSLTQIAGVVSARVHVMLPETSPLDHETAEPRVSVFIYHQPSVDMSDQIPVIKYLITNSVNGLKYDDVAVAMFPANNADVVPKSSSFWMVGDGLLKLVIVLAALLLGLVVFRKRITQVFGQQA